MANRWNTVSLPRAILVAIVNLLFVVPWYCVMLVSYVSWDEKKLLVGPKMAQGSNAFYTWLGLFYELPTWFHHAKSQMAHDTRYGIAVALLALVIAVFLMNFFILLPFAARPGDNRACLRHTLRTVLLSTGWIHIWFPVLSLVFLSLIFFGFRTGFENAMAPILMSLALLMFWTLVGQVRAVRTDYRSAAELPKPKDPTCDVCGYDLRAAASDGRCPECGKPVVESLGQANRPLTEWERHPSWLRLGAVFRQLYQLVFAPRSLFYSMPTREGQRAAQHWLIGSMVLVGLEAYLIVPSFAAVGVFEWWIGLFAGGLAVAVVWALLALMMVGIETAGIVVYGRFHGLHIELSAASKATCYSSILMLFWVFLGGCQLVALAAFWNNGYARHYLPRVSEGISVGSLAVAHIAGLLWYELTVYRGVRAIQYANK